MRKNKMKRIIRITLTLLATSAITGCCVFAKNEDINAFWNTKEERIEKFKEHTDYHIGKPLYGLKSDLCGTQYKCQPIGEKLVEYMPLETSKDKCQIAWTVNEESIGKYIHPTNGIEFDIAGHIKSWRYISKEEECLYTIGYCAPW